MISISNTLYDFLKLLALLALPALGTLYFVLGKGFGLPGESEVVGSVMGAIFILGVVLQLASRGYAQSDARFDGEMEVKELGDRQVVQMAFSDDRQLETLTEKKEVRFKVTVT